MRRVINAAVTAIFFGTLALAPQVLGQTAPMRLAQASAAADNNIKSANSDLDRLEKQAKGLRPGASGAKRVLKLLGLTQGRLNSSPNKNHPSWVQANERLGMLKNRLLELAAGRNPDAAPAAATTPAPTTPDAKPVKPETPPGSSLNPRLARATSELNRINTAFQAMPPGDKVTGSRLINDMNKVAAELKAYPNRRDPNWVRAAQNYNVLNKKIVARANAAPTGGQPAQSASGDQTPADPNVERAARELALIDRQVKNLRPADQRGGMRFHKDLGRIAKVLNQAANKAHPTWKSTVAEFRRINDHIITTLMRDINAKVIAHSKKIDTMSELELLTKKTSDQARSELQKIWNAAAAFGAPKHRDVQTFIATHRAADLKLVNRINAAIAEHNKLGDVKAKVNNIEQRMKSLPVPQPLRAPFDADGIKAYAMAIKKAQEASVEDVAYLKRISGKTPLIASQRLGRLLHWVGRKPDEVQKSAAQTVQAVDAWVNAGIGTSDFLATTDINDRGHVANRLLGPGQHENTLKKLEDAAARMETAQVLDQAIARQGGPDRAAQKTKILNAITGFNNMFDQALAASRMPKPAMDDEKYIAIAKKTLTNPKYKTVKPHKRLVINSKVRRKEKKEATASGNTLTVYHYVWDQYQVATAEKTDDKYHIWYTTLKYFYKGGSTTPTDRWIVSGRHQSIQILEENIVK